MVDSKPRYFVEKPQKGGSILCYWQPSKALARAGFKTVPLSRNRAEAIQQAEALNQQVDKWRGGMPVLAKNTHGTLPWLIDTYKHSPKWAKLRDGSKKDYECPFRHFLRWSAERGDPPMRTITRRDAEQFWTARQAMPYRAVQLLRLLSMLWNYALDLDEDIVARNPFQRLDLPARPSRSQVWQPGQIERFIQTALTPGPWGRTRGGRPDRPHGPRPSVALAVIIGINTAQRPSDVLALNWSQYDGRYITLTQIKTRATVTIPVTDALKIALDDAKRARTEGTVVAFAADGPIVLSETSGQRYEASRFAAIFRMIKAAAGIPRDLEYRDLRRTATTHLAEAGCSTHQIASIGGWSIDTVARMMSVYGKVNVTMAESAILKLEQYRKRPLEG